ncbi:MAG TPA: FliM/FliN family flagellar motor switch protein [Woeseiaceae bacterium]|nr:FliM/FliN family flagellar motor switch protein [Woeseiaceae bacterium]
MNDQLISDDEKNALLEGVERGDIEVQSRGGSRYAQVDTFVIASRNCIVSNSFPRLQKLNRNLAGTFGKSVSALLNEKVDVLPGNLDVCTWGEFLGRSRSTAVLFEFSASPMSGSGVVFVEAELVRHLVETFYGGSKIPSAPQNAAGFTQGERNVTALYCEELLRAVVASWQGLADLEARRVGVHQSTDIIEVLETGAEIVACQFETQLGESSFPFYLVWPAAMLEPFIPVLEGQKQTRDPAEDARWEQVLRSRVPEAKVALTSCTGSAHLSLRKVAQLAVGDIIDLEMPRKGTVFAGHVPVLEGHFGVHDGRYAIEAGQWLTNERG